jgi:geranylgeranyl pyrophosphate synthase
MRTTEPEEFLRFPNATGPPGEPVETSSEPLSTYLDGLRTRVEQALARALPAEAPDLIVDAMKYALLGGGKRLRPCLTLATAEAVSSLTGHTQETAFQLALPSACAVELVHSYSLVHDDLPAMDNDTLRRGRPTTHVVVGEGLAILAGDGLLTEAFSLIAHSPSRVVPSDAPVMPAESRIRAIGVLGSAAGALGMVGGQAIDLSAAGRVLNASSVALDVTGLQEMHSRKTGALIRAAATLGAIAAGGSDAIIAAVDQFACELGLAFQIIDDVLDVEGSDGELGKTAGKDAAASKPTYPALYGVAASRRLAAECIDRGKAALAEARLDGRLPEIADWSLARRK